MNKILVQIFLPLSDNNGERFIRDWYVQISRELNERFGGVTMYHRTPVTGLWKEEEQHTIKDELIIYEVMADKIDPAFWQPLKKKLEVQFRQENILIRTFQIEVM